MNLLDVTIVPMRTRVPVTTNMFVVLVIGGIVAAVLSMLPARYALFSRLVVVLTIVATVGVGIADLGGGDAFGERSTDAQTPPKCVGWDGFVETYEHVHAAHEDVLIAWNEEDLTASGIDSLVSRISILTDDLAESSPPPAAAKVHKQLMSILSETDKQLRSYADGGDFNPRRLSRLQDGLGGLVDTANEACA
jgi:hypothetical protein